MRTINARVAIMESLEILTVTRTKRESQDMTMSTIEGRGVYDICAAQLPFLCWGPHWSHFLSMLWTL